MSNDYASGSGLCNEDPNITLCSFSTTKLLIWINDPFIKAHKIS